MSYYVLTGVVIVYLILVIFSLIERYFENDEIDDGGDELWMGNNNVFQSSSWSSGIDVSWRKQCYYTFKILQENLLLRQFFK